MVAMVPFKINLDYEASLFDPNYLESSSASHKIIREFEYIYFIVQKEKSIIKNFKGYEEKYLNSLRGMGFVIPTFAPKATLYEYWWGSHHNRELEQKLNSKLTSVIVAQENNWGFQEGAIVENMEQLKSHLNKNPYREKWILKNAHGFSGIGHFQFSSSSLDELEKNIVLKCKNEKLLLEPYYERMFDIGTTFVINMGVVESKFMVENFNSPSGRFSGGVGARDANVFKEYIFKKYSYSLNELELITDKIAKCYLNMGAQCNVQIDSFVYKENGKLKLYSLVEVNYRKTMGLVIQALCETFKITNLIEWRIESAKHNFTSAGWTKISPEGNHFHSYFKEVKS